MADQRSTKVVPKVQAWYAFWYAGFSSHDMFSSHCYLRRRTNGDEINMTLAAIGV